MLLVYNRKGTTSVRRRVSGIYKVLHITDKVLKYILYVKWLSYVITHVLRLLHYRKGTLRGFFF